MKLPGLIDCHVHLREPGAVHKEDWDSGTAAALAGGVTTVLAMPNTQPPVTGREPLKLILEKAADKARCDYGVFFGATADNASEAAALSHKAAGLKLYLDNTYGPLMLEDMTQWTAHLSSWPRDRPIAAHAERRTLAALILAASLAGRPIHLCHVARQEEILLIRAAKEQGLKVTCEVAPHHLFLCEDDAPALGPGRSRVCPSLATRQDQQALWDNLDVVDCFATDHAPHTLEEKDGPDAPPGFPGLEAALPLLLTAVRQGRLELQDIITRMHDNPRRIFGLPPQPDTHVELDLDARWELSAKEMHCRCGWTPYEGWAVEGRVRRVVLRGQEVFADGEMLAKPGYGECVGKRTL